MIVVFPLKLTIEIAPPQRWCAIHGIYKVTQLLPPEGDAHQYRIKNVDEPHERVIKESHCVTAEPLLLAAAKATS